MLLEFAEREGIDVMIMGKRESKTMVQAMVPGTKKLSSTSDQFKSRAKCPVLVVRPAVRPPGPEIRAWGLSRAASAMPLPSRPRVAQGSGMTY